MKIYVLAKHKTRFRVQSDFLVIHDDRARFCATYDELLKNLQLSEFKRVGWYMENDRTVTAIRSALTFYKTAEEILVVYPELCV